MNEFIWSWHVQTSESLATNGFCWVSLEIGSYFELWATEAKNWLVSSFLGVSGMQVTKGTETLNRTWVCIQGWLLPRQVTLVKWLGISLSLRWFIGEIHCMHLCENEMNICGAPGTRKTVNQQPLLPSVLSFSWLSWSALCRSNCYWLQSAFTCSCWSDKSASEVEQVTSGRERPTLDDASGATWQGHCWKGAELAGRLA